MTETRLMGYLGSIRWNGLRPPRQHTDATSTPVARSRKRVQVLCCGKEGTAKRAPGKCVVEA